MPTPRPTTSRPRTATAPEGGIARGHVLLWISLVGFAWLGLIALLVMYPWSSGDRTHHWALALISATVGLATFGPVESVLRTNGITVRGMFGLVVLTHVIVYVPVPSRSILSLAEVPVYLIVALALFYTVGSLAMPGMYALGKRVFARRSRRHDARRAWRQATELGAFLFGCVILIGLRAFTPMLAGLWLLMVVFAEYIFLSYIEPPVER
ncbi:MAG: hypothetical protein ACK5S9_06180 [Roseiflexaceae bacterium]